MRVRVTVTGKRAGPLNHDSVTTVAVTLTIVASVGPPYRHVIL